MSKVAIADDSAPVELEGGQVIINKQASKKHWRDLSKINQSAGGGLPLHEPQFKKGGIVSNDCIDFIRNSKAIINNGYYLNLSELSSIRDAYGQVPTNLKQTLITYNSGGQKNLKVTNTINAIELRKKLQSLLGIDSSQAYIVLNYYIDNARRFDTLDILDEIKHTQIAIIDRDKIVCNNMKHKNNNKISRSQKQYNKDVDAYKYFIVDLKNKKAISGWEYKQDAVDALSDYDGDTNFKVVAQVTLNKMGIENPKERFKKMSNGGNAGFDLPFGVEVNFETEGDYELEIDDFEDKLMILYQYIDFKDVYGESDSYNTNLKFYGEYELLASIKGSYNEKRDSYDCLLIIDGESSNINFHPYNTLGGLDIGEFENQIKTSVQKLSNYSAVVSIEGYEVDGENYISEETAKVGIKNLKEKTEFNLVKGKRFGQGKRVEQDKVIEKYAKGGAITTVDLNRIIEQYNSEGRSFELRGAYGNYELWSKGNRLEVGSRKDIYNALVKYRFNEKYEQGGSIGFIPMDLEEKLALLSKWGGTNIRGVLGLLNAMIDTGVVDEDLVIKPTKNTRFQREKAIEKKIQEIWEKIQPRYNQELKGNMYYSTLKELIGRNFIYKDILQRFKPFRKYQKFEQGGSTDCECYHYEIGGL